MEEKMVVDPVCRMTIDPATAAAREDFEGKPVYFCSEGCRHRFLENPAAYAAAVAGPAMRGGHECCSVTSGHDRHRLSPLVLGTAAAAGLLASAIALSFYFGVLTLVSGWQFTVEQFTDWWPYIVALASGFGIEVGLFVYLRRAVHAAASGKVMMATGATSGAAMLSCCTHLPRQSLAGPRRDRARELRRCISGRAVLVRHRVESGRHRLYRPSCCVVRTWSMKHESRAL
jgi:YHS domain-containing protein